LFFVVAFAGEEARIWLQHASEILPHIVYLSATAREQAVACYQGLADVFTKMHNPPPFVDAKQYAADKKKWAAEFKKCAYEFRRKCMAAPGITGKDIGNHIYIHLMCEHFPDLMEIYGDLRPFSGESLEHVNKYCNVINVCMRRPGKKDKKGRLYKSWTVKVIKRLGLIQKWSKTISATAKRKAAAKKKKLVLALAKKGV